VVDEAVAAAEAEPEVEEAAGDAAEAVDDAGEASPFAEVQPRRTGRPGKKRDRWEPEVRGVVKGKAAKKERKAAAAAAAAASSAAANDDDEGLELMRSASSATGYMGVTYAPKGNPTKPYQAAHGDEHLGFFARPVEATRAIARHARLLEGAAASEFPEVMDAAPPAPPPKPKAAAAKAAAKAPKAKGSSSAPAAVAPNAPPYTAEQVAAARAAIAAAVWTRAACRQGPGAWSGGARRRRRLPAHGALFVAVGRRAAVGVVLVLPQPLLLCWVTRVSG